VVLQAGTTGRFGTLVSWAMFSVWLTFNILDIVISILATQAGAVEIGLLYRLTGTWVATAINKMLLAVIIGIMLVYLRKNKWFAALNLGIFGLCLYNGYVLLGLLS
jgi:hypothetical protein